MQPGVVREVLAARLANWQLPGGFVFTTGIPLTSVRKFRKMALREKFVSWKDDVPCVGQASACLGLVLALKQKTKGRQAEACPTGGYVR